MTQDSQLRNHVLDLLRGSSAHISFDEFVAGVSPDLINRKIDGVPYTLWQVLEHMRIAQWDILEFSRDGTHVSPAFPEGYWPSAGVVADAEQWNQTVSAFRSDFQAFMELVGDPSVDLFAPLNHGTGQTILREALVVADHNAYHLGTLALMKRVLEKDNGSN